MDKIDSTIKQGVINNKRYHLNPIESDIKLHMNESPYDLPDSIKRIIVDKVAAAKWNAYPDFIPQKLYQKIADYLNVSPDNLLIGNGSNEMIFTSLAASLEKGKKIVLPSPTFSVYKLIASNLNANICEVKLNNDMSYNADAIIKEVADAGSIAVICNPNNPTGSLLSVKEIESILIASGGIVVIDEAYIHFGGDSVVNLISKYKNLLVLRTFSKAFGLAGLRIGMMIGSKELIQQFAKVKLPYNLNIFSILTLDTVIDNYGIIDDHIKMIKVYFNSPSSKKTISLVLLSNLII